MDVEHIPKYKKENYKIKDIINQLMKLNILRNSVNCPKGNALMNLTDKINYKDGCVKKGNRPDMKPAESYFNKIIKENSVATFDNWKGLALVDSFTMLGKEDSFDKNDCNYLYFPLIYLRCIFEKTFCFSRNNSYREDKVGKGLMWEIEQMEKYYFYDNISYNFQPNLLYQAMANGLGIKKEREELTKQVKEQEEHRFDKILAYVAIFAVFSVVWDICSIVMKAIPQFESSWTAVVFIVFGVVVAGAFVFKIKNKRHETK